MSEENENKAEPVPQKQLGYDPNAAIADRLSRLDCEAGEAILAIKINVSADSEGTKLGIGVRIIGPKTEKVKSLVGGLLTMGAHNVAEAIRDAVKPMLTEDFTAPILLATEKEFAEAIGEGRKKNGAGETPATPSEEVPHGV